MVLLAHHVAYALSVDVDHVLAWPIPKLRRWIAFLKYRKDQEEEEAKKK